MSLLVSNPHTPKQMLNGSHKVNAQIPLFPRKCVPRPFLLRDTNEPYFMRAMQSSLSATYPRAHWLRLCG